jgi:hypothetical protein
MGFGDDDRRMPQKLGSHVEPGCAGDIEAETAA